MENKIKLLYLTNQIRVKLYLTFFLLSFLNFLNLFCVGFNINVVFFRKSIFIKWVDELNLLAFFKKKKLNSFSEKRYKYIFSKKMVLLKKFFLLKKLSQVLFQYICDPRRFNIGKLD